MTRWAIPLAGAFGGALAVGSVLCQLDSASAVGTVLGLWMAFGAVAWWFMRQRRSESTRQGVRDSVLESLVARVDAGLMERRALEERALVTWTDALAASTGRLDAGVAERRMLEEESLARRREADRAAVDALNDGVERIASAFEARAEHVVEGFGVATQQMVAAIDRRFDELFAVVRDRFGEASKNQETLLSTAVAEAQRHGGEAEERHVQRVSEAFERFDRALDAQAERVASFEANLMQHRHDAAEALGNKLDRYANELRGQLEATSRIVDEAAACVRTGGIEMNAVAEMFGHAVDRQRAAADDWLGTLRKVDGAVLRAGEQAAVEALDHYLTRTHELFDHQLELQEELLGRLGVARPTDHSEERIESAVQVVVPEARHG